MKTSTLMNFALSAAFVLAIGLKAGADPVVIGDSSKGTPVTTVTDGKKKVEITTTGITVDKGDADEDEDRATDNQHTKIKFSAANGLFAAKGFLSELEDILVPVAFFIFLVFVILGGKYFSSRNEQRRLELLKLMVEKGQPVPENVMNQILTPQKAPEADGKRQTYTRTRNAYGFTVAGVALIGYALVTHQLKSDTLVPGLVFLCIGVGGLAGLYLPKHDEKING